MTNKLYDILLDDEKIGSTELENADAPMGVVFGQINFTSINSGYDFFKNYCLKNNIKFTDHPEDRLIIRMNIPNLKVFDINGNEIKGHGGCLVNGIDSDIFEITILGIPYPFYQKEFPHHVKTYNELYKDQQ
ncbi:MAG TPA: hypothetical protein VE978_25520 [Chitinophagales bacterium]|nr:hypothetical protein [Chitinophagales bacterium]